MLAGSSHLTLPLRSCPAGIQDDDPFANKGSRHTEGGREAIMIPYLAGQSGGCFLVLR